LKFVIKDDPALFRSTAKVKNGIWAKMGFVVYFGVRVNFWIDKAPIVAIILFRKWAKVRPPEKRSRREAQALKDDLATRTYLLLIWSQKRSRLCYAAHHKNGFFKIK
jgi:hypothetical protein